MSSARSLQSDFEIPATGIASPSRKVHSRSLLLESAEKLFLERGYAAVSTREIAEGAGVNLGSIQYHFGSKAALFIETVRCLMKKRTGANVSLLISPEPQNAKVAALQLCRFIRDFLFELLQPTEQQHCRLMFREILSDNSREPGVVEALISSVVEEFIRPVDEKLINLLRKLSPSLENRELWLTAQSIVGQCTYYVTHRLFAERLRGINLTESDLHHAIAQHVCRFSLRALGLNEIKIDSYLESVAQKNQNES